MSKQAIGPITLIGLVIANMIGAGVFTTSGFALGDLGSPFLVLAAWLVGGMLAVCGALSYGALSRLMPVSGGEYLFLSRSVHPLAGFIAGWVSLLAGFTGAIAYAAITFEAYVLPDGYTAIAPNAIATIAIILAALFHGVRVKHGAIIQNITVTLKLSLIAGFILFAVFGPDISGWDGIKQLTEQNSEPQAFSLPAFALTLMWISFSYSGFNAAIYVASEVKDASKAVPRALFYATFITAIIYLLLNAIFIFAPAQEAVAYQKEVAAIAANSLGGELLETAVRIIIAMALFTSVSAMIMVGPRVYAQMAEDGLMPKALKITRDAPDIAIIMQAFLAIIVVWIAGLRELLSYLGFTLGLSAAATVASLFLIVRRRPEQGLNLPGYPWAPSVFVGFTLLFAGLAAMQEPWEMLAAILTIVSGVIMYFLVKRFVENHE